MNMDDITRDEYIHRMGYSTCDMISKWYLVGFADGLGQWPRIWKDEGILKFPCAYADSYKMGYLDSKGDPDAI